MVYKLSPTTLSLLEECPRCFWLHIVKKIKRPRIPIAGIVMRMDSLIKKYFEKYRKLEKLPPIIENKINGKLAKNMPSTLSFAKDDIVLIGKPDEFIEQDGKIVSLDHKTKSKPPKETHASHQLQLDVYSYLLKMNNYKTTDKGFLAYYYPCEDCELHEGLSIDCKVVEVKTNIARVEKLLEKAKAILKMEKVPEENKNCIFCRWRNF